MTDNEDITQIRHKNIFRIDDRYSPGWRVRVYRNGDAYGHFYSDGQHGGSEGALRKAIANRDEILSRYPKRAIPYRTELTAANSTGVIGIYKTHQIWGKHRRRVECYVASWREYRGQPRKKFFFTHHFETPEAAFEAAVAFRKEKEREIKERVEAGKYDPSEEG